ncbi:hypothetical protein C2E21_7483 [Chlorella sorokiniana]|uniref:Uncharacterized protein n=1 Tax=Chlorella sorokiniana TaxID=3076 RepID=A0A2P6TI32_CHLSO|nr:hypothetical protein C2E21_7483 [Chlorella sorokiniana]|eukprot:PRW33955.1 hypothetical protein C2E21_7483 [Chlorella sorokiniana]
MQTALAFCPVVAGAASARPAARRVSGARLAPLQQRRLVQTQALGDNANKQSKGIRREDEPEEYWSSKGEREGKNPLSDPLAQIGILAILFPFIFLAIAIAFGLVDLSGGR